MSRRRVSTHAPSNYKRRMPPRGSRVSGGNRHDIGGYSAGKKRGGTRGDTRLVYQMENPWNRVCHVACAKKEKKEKGKKRPTVSLKMNRSGTLVEWNVFSREIKPRLPPLVTASSSAGIKERGKTRPS